MQFYDIADYEGDEERVIAGAQDNGINFKTTNTTTWNNASNSGDGMDCMIDPSTPARFYGASQQSLRRRNSATETWTNITPASACPNQPQFDIHIDMDLTNTDRIYFGDGCGISRSDDRGSSWTSLNNGFVVGGSRMIKLGVDDPSVLYAATLSALSVTFNATSGTPTWSNRTPSGSPINITDITVNPANSDEVAVCMAGFSNGNKVFISDDAGSNWTNISGSLPNIPMNCIEWAPGSNNGLYVGADVGVYYRDDDLGDWVPHRNGLPHTPITDLEIHEATGKLRAGTFGRGMWESPLYVTCAENVLLTAPLPVSGIFLGPEGPGYVYHKASNNLSSNKIIDGGVGTNVTYQAGHMVALTTGFVAAENSIFRAFNSPCDHFIPNFITGGPELTGTYAGPMEGVVQPTVGLEDLDGEKEYLLVYPNPTNGLVNIEFRLDGTKNSSLLITDLSGREVAKVISSRQISGGSYKVSHNVSTLSPGIYLCRLLVGERVFTERISVVD
jgi:hypothetical protein